MRGGRRVRAIGTLVAIGFVCSLATSALAVPDGGRGSFAARARSRTGETVPARGGGLTPLLTGRADELWPSSDATSLAWVQNSRAHPRHFDAFVRPAGGGAKTKMNRRGTETGITTSTDDGFVVFSEFAGDRTSPSVDIRAFEIADDRRFTPPGINSPSWELSPSIDDDLIVFNRWKAPRLDTLDRVLLYDGSTDSTELLFDETSDRGFIGDGTDVTGDWAAWASCGSGRCTVRRHDLVGDQTEAAPNPNDKIQYYPAVFDDGTLYFVQSGAACGRNVRILRWQGTGAPEVVLAFPTGVDIAGLTVMHAEINGTVPTLLLSRFRCDRGNADGFAYHDDAWTPA